MSNTEKISVIIPVYNTASCLPRCLDSVLAQTYRNIEILAVDDGSTDESGRILDEYAARDARIKVIHQPNAGQSAARNRALDIAEGKWVSFADSDDKCEPDMLETLMNAAAAANADVCWGGHILHYISRKTACRRVPGDGVFSGEKLPQLYYNEPNGPSYLWAALYRKKCFEELRFPEGRIYEDLWILPRIIGSIDRAACVGKPVYHYYLSETGTVNGCSLAKQMDMLRAQEENVEYTILRFPEWEGCARRKLLEICADLLGRISRAGIRKNRGYMERVCRCFDENSRKLSSAGMKHKCVILLFRISPSLCAKCCQLYALMSFRLRGRGTWRDNDAR